MSSASLTRNASCSNSVEIAGQKLDRQKLCRTIWIQTFRQASQSRIFSRKLRISNFRWLMTIILLDLHMMLLVKFQCPWAKWWALPAKLGSQIWQTTARMLDKLLCARSPCQVHQTWSQDSLQFGKMLAIWEEVAWECAQNASSILLASWKKFQVTIIDSLPLIRCQPATTQRRLAWTSKK